MADIPTTSWDETSPAGTQAISLGDNRIRELKTQLREVIEIDHNFSSSGQDADYGKHNQISLLEQADLGTGAEGKPILGAQTVDGKAELLFTDEDDNDVQLTSGGNSIATHTPSDSAPTDDEGIANKKYVDDNAVFLTGDQTVAGEKTFSTFPITPSAAPDADYEVANKKYVDDTVVYTTGLGAWTEKSADTAYEAETDGFVFWYKNGAVADFRVKFYMDDTDATTQILDYYDRSSGGVEVAGNGTYPVPKGKFWKVSSGPTKIYWIPLS